MPSSQATGSDEVRRHLADTRFAWMGGVEPDGVFYYRVHSDLLRQHHARVAHGRTAHRHG